MTLGQNIQQLRKKHNLTQKEFAKSVGKSLSTIQKYEADEVSPSIQTLNKIALFFNVNVNDLVGSNDKVGNQLMEQLEELQENINELKPEQIFNYQYYKRLKEDDLISLLNGANFEINIENYKNLSKELKEKFLTSLSNISVVNLLLKRQLDNFDQMTKEDLMNLCADIQDFYTLAIDDFIEKEYNTLSNKYNKAIELLKSYYDLGNLHKDYIDKSRDILVNLLKKIDIEDIE